MKPTKHILQIILLASLMLVGQISFGQTDTTKVKANVQIEGLNKEIKEDAEKIKQLTEAVQDLKTQNAVLTKSLDTLTIFFFIFGSIISIILIISTITSLISWNTDRKRSSETYSLALQKEKESSERDRSIFSQSTDTLTLVNQINSIVIWPFN